MNEWQPIETAPVAMTVDLWVIPKNKDFPPMRYAEMTYLKGEWRGARRLYPGDKITHWMMPPRPPK